VAGDPAVFAGQATGCSPRRRQEGAERHLLHLRSGWPWADLPERYGPYTTVYNRFTRWRKAGVWDKLMDAIIAAHDGKVQMIDSSVVRVHQQAAAQKNRLETLVSVEVVED
jgi:transposase